MSKKPLPLLDGKLAPHSPKLDLWKEVRPTTTEDKLARRRRTQRSLLLLSEGGFTRNPEALLIHSLQVENVVSPGGLRSDYPLRLVRRAQRSCPGPMPPGLDATLTEAGEKRLKQYYKRDHGPMGDRLATTTLDRRIFAKTEAAVVAEYLRCRYRTKGGYYMDADDVSVTVTRFASSLYAQTVWATKVRKSGRQTAHVTVHQNWLVRVAAHGIARVEGRLVLDALHLPHCTYALTVKQSQGIALATEARRLRQDKVTGQWRIVKSGSRLNWEDLTHRLKGATIP
jgi:hypothetical protein